MPTLYYSPGACSLAVHIVLEWIGAPYEAVKVDHHAREYRKINPAGAYATPMLNWALAKLPDGLQPYPACKAHRDRMLADPAVQRVMKAEGL